MAGEKVADLIFEGGGVKGIGLAGAYAALEQRGFTPKGLAGASAGAITAALIAAGYNSAELDEILLNIPFFKFKTRGGRTRCRSSVPPPASCSSAASTRGGSLSGG